MAGATEDQENGPRVSPELVQKVCGILRVATARQEELASEILSIGTAFASHRSIECFWGLPGEQRKAIRKLIRSAEDTLIALYSVSAEYLVALEPMLQCPSPLVGDDDLITRTRTALLELHEAALRFDKAYKPRRGAAVDLILEEAVRALMGLFARNDFDAPQVTPCRENQDPKLRNKEAEAIAELLCGIDPKTQVRSVVNMITAVKSGRPPSEAHLHEIWRTALSATTGRRYEAVMDRKFKASPGPI